MYRSSLHYGWKPDLPDHRDLKYAAPKIDQLPAKVDLRSSCPPVYDQGQLGSCSANAIGGAFEFELLRQKLQDFVPSRLFIYYNERAIENTINSDSGAQLRDGIKSIANLGVCPETSWPYIISEFAVKPFAVCYADALKHTAINYQRVAQDIDQMKGCLADGYPFVAGFTVYSGFESPQVAQTGTLNLPQPDEQVVGGHAILVVGYDDSQNRFIVRNSWGTDWGIGGYFTMPYDYLTNEDLASDFWTVRLVADNPTAPKPGARGNESSLKPGLAMKLGSPMTVNVDIKFTGGAPNTVDVTLNLGQNQHVINSRIITYDNVNSNDAIDVIGNALATTTIKIDKPTTPATPFIIVPGPVNANFTIN